MAIRPIQKIIQRAQRHHGDGPYFYTEPLPGPGAPDLDPFLLLHHHGPMHLPPLNAGMPFGPHPHRGFETATFVLKGSLVHRDTQGFSSEISSGGVQWMTAGRGLIHNEFSSKKFMEEGGDLELIQLWINLPARLRMTTPSYSGVQADQTTTRTLEEGGVRLRVYSGEVAGVAGPLKTLTGITSAMIEMQAGTRWTLPTSGQQTVLFYLLNGELELNGQKIQERSLVNFEHQDGELQITAVNGSTILICLGEPIREKYVWQGPFVMNTETEILQAIRDYQIGKFGFYIE